MVSTYHAWLIIANDNQSLSQSNYNMSQFYHSQIDSQIYIRRDILNL